MKAAGIIKIIVGSIAAVLFAAVLTGVLLGYPVFDNLKWTSGVRLGSAVSGGGEKDSTLIGGEAKIDPAEVSALEIQWIAGSVTVVTGDVNEITLTEKSAGTLSDAQKMRYSLENGKLKVYFAADMGENWKWSTLSALTNLNKDLIVTIPKTLPASLDSLDVETVSASVTLEALAIREIDVETVSGAEKLTSLAGKELSASGVSGSIRIESCAFSELSIENVSGAVHAAGAFDTIEADGTSGEVQIQCSQTPESIDVNTVSGSIRVSLPADAGFTADLDSVSGSIMSEFACVMNGRRLTCGDGACKCSFESVSGSVRLLVLN